MKKETDIKPASPVSLNNNNLEVKEAEIKREEAMVEDEMKEDSDEAEVDDTETESKNETSAAGEIPASAPAVAPPVTGEVTPENLKALQFNFFKKLCEDMKSKSKVETTEEMVNNGYEQESLVSDSGNDQDLQFNNSGDERKVRVRTLISDEQLTILKSYYAKNPRPKREELERISEQIGHPFKVVKVWFQNSRARDRREGKPVTNMSGPGGLPASFFMNGQSEAVLGNNLMAATASGLFPRLPLLGPLINGQNAGQPSEEKSPSRSSEVKSPYSTASDEPVLTSKPASNTDQPLDLSNKGSSPSVSPLSVTKDGLEDTVEALNLSHGVNPAGDFLEHFRRAAAVLGSTGPQTVNGAATACSTAASSVASVASSVSALAAVAANQGGNLGPLDIYRFQEELETSGSAGSGGATTDEEGKFTCDKCDKTFTKQSSLSRHKYEHSGR